MMKTLSRLLTGRILFDKSDDGGSGGGDTDAPAMTPPPASDRSTGGMPQAIPMNEGNEPAPSSNGTDSDGGSDAKSNGESTGGADEIRKSIKETSSKLPKKEMKDKVIPYFEDQEDDAGDDDGSESATSDEASTKPEGDAPTGDDTGADEKAKDKYYDPEVHAEGKEVYPNAYNTRQDAEYAIAAKLERYDELSNSLQEVDSEVGSTVPADIQEKIDSYKDVTALGDADDAEIRDFIVNLDMAIKSVDEKQKNVSTRYNQKQKESKVSETYQQAQQKAGEASRELGLDRKINNLPENATFEDVLTMADDMITEKLQPVEQEIADMEENTQFAKEKGQTAWLQKIRELENKKSDLESSLKEDRKALIEFNDARLEKENMESSKPVKLTDKERIQKMDDIYGSWADDRSQGQFVLEMFQAPTTDPVLHFRKFAFAPANVNKYDLTTKAGWDKMHNHWKTTMQERFNNQQSQDQKKQTQKKQSSVNEPIPDPPIENGTNVAPKGSHYEMQKARERIRQNAKNLFRNR